MAQNAKPAPYLPQPAISNGVVTAPSTRGIVGGNRKKQKRRAKQAARQVSDPDHSYPIDQDARNGQVAQGHTTLQHPTSYHEAADAQLEYDDPDYDDPNDFDAPGQEYYTDEEEDLPQGRYMNINVDIRTDGSGMYAGEAPLSPSKRKNKKKRRSTQYSAQYEMPFNTRHFVPPSMSNMPLPTPPPPPMSAAALRSVQRSAKQDRIWNTSTQEERERIKEFWLSLSEEERKSLLKIEKEAVLRKMKEQQKHSCSCTVCGRKRTAIEEELEVLYDAYYEELEQYANHQHPGEQGEGTLSPSRSHSQTSGHMRQGSAVPLPLSTGNPQHRTSRVHEILDDGEEEVSEDEDEEYSDEEDELYSDAEEGEDDEIPANVGVDFFNFGNSLTVKGGILTVADDLLKNDGKKFIEMMEQLAERRMRREQEAEYAATQPSQAYANGHDLDDEEYDEEDEEYDSEDGYDDEDEDDETQSSMNDEQRMKEGRRMFQIFAARMFEQRVLTAYREKVAAERQQKLLEELEDESKLDAQREAKKARDAEKKKAKKLAQKQAKAEEKARKDAEKAAEEAAQRAIEEKKRVEQQRKRDEQRKKKEAERKALEEEKQRKEAERLKRQQLERERQQEAERKAREQKALEKQQREDAKRKEREEREVREKEAKEKRAEEERLRREKEARVKAEQEARRSLGPVPPQIIKRPSQAGMVAVPPGLHNKQAGSGFPSPHVPVATPAIPKAPTPAKQRQSSQQGSHASSPKTPLPFAGPSKSTSPTGASGPHQANVTPMTILQKPQNQQPPVMHHPQPTSPITQMPPPGMQPQHQHSGFGGMPPMGFSNYGAPHGPMMHNNHQRQQLPMFPQQGSMGGQFGRPFQAGPPPGMNGLGMIPQNRSYSIDGPPGFAPQQMSPVGPPSAAPGFGISRDTMPSHSRQHSATDKIGIDAAKSSGPAQPITRPAPIQRPSSVKPHEGNTDRKQSGASTDVDDLSNHLGSRALLDDVDDPLPPAAEARRQSNAAGPGRTGPIGFSSPISFASGQPRMDPFGNPNSSWSSPGMAFGHPPGLVGAQSWGSGLNTPGWPNSNGFGSLSGAPRPSIANRPLTIRLAVCQACKQLAASKPANDGYHDVQLLLRQIDANRAPLDPPPTLKEIEDICETEGDAQNGGGLLHVRHGGGTEGSFSVRFESDAGTPNHSQTVGEIGSPMPGNSIPALNRFGSIGGGVISPTSNF